MTDQNNQLVIIAKESGLEAGKIDGLLQSFGKSFQEAKKIAEESKTIIVTDEKQVDLMHQARTARLALKQVRVDVENNRKSLKEQALREGKAIDGMANIIKALVIPVEEHLEKQEKFAELRETARKAERYADRVQKLVTYGAEPSLYNLNEMTDESFEKLLTDVKATFEARKVAEQKVEADRLAKIEADRIEQERIRRENEELKIKQAKLEADKKKAEESVAKERAAKEAELKKEREEQEKKAQIERQQQQEALRIEREKREKIEAKIKADKEAELAKKQAEDEVKRQALLAPDKEKLMNLHADIQAVKMPAVSSKQAADVIAELQQKVVTLTDWLYEEAKKL